MGGAETWHREHPFQSQKYVHTPWVTFQVFNPLFIDLLIGWLI